MASQQAPAHVVQLRKGATLEMIRLTCPDAVHATRIAESFGLHTCHWQSSRIRGMPKPR